MAVASAVLVVTVLALALLPLSLWAMAGALVLFFAAFNFLEAKLPALVSVRAPANAKGSASGVFASLQFLGIFTGATLGGWVAQNAGNVAVLWVCTAISILWLIAALGIKPLPASTGTQQH